MNEKICPFCGKSFVKEFSDDAYYGKHCYECSYWLKKVHLPEKYRQKQAIVNGEHFMIGDEGPTVFRGMGGRRYTILFNDGRLVDTRNLWHQGTIPGEFRLLLKDNAVFSEDTVKSSSVPASVDEGFGEIPF